MFRASLIWLALLIALSGCAHQGELRSQRLRQALEQEERGEKAYLAGNLEASRRHYQNALSLNSAIENAHGIAVATASLAQIDSDLGQYAPAQAKLSVVLDDREHLFVAADRADAAARLARIALVLRQNDEAEAMARKALGLCEASKCRLQAAILNLRAQAAIARDALIDSALLAQSALQSARNQGQWVEQANSLRLLGRISLLRKAALDALPLFDQALSIDKRLGIPAKISEDLEDLAQAAEALGQHDAARAYRNRASMVRRALGEPGQ